MTFEKLGLSEELLRSVRETRYTSPTPIQAQAIPAILEGKDVMAAAQTGTGKTAGFTLPLLQLLNEKPPVKNNRARALVLTPTRELAAQVQESVFTYGKHLQLRSAVVFGGVKINPQMMKLRRGVDVLVATPGRLLDLFQQRAINFNDIEILVLDEADRMLDMGFIHDIKKIMALLPKQRQTLMFSATFSQEIRQLAKGIINNPVEIDVASEYRYREPPIPARTLAIFVSQSGETADTLAALRYCKGKADKIVSIINVPESSIARESNLSLPIHAGIEVGVASTKAFTCQLSVLFILAIKAAHTLGEISEKTFEHHIQNLRNLPALVNLTIEKSSQIQKTARKLCEVKDVLFLGRGVMYPLALEGALKLKEISYIHAEAYASGELKHGPIALIDKNVPVVVMAPKDPLFEKTISNMHEVMARKGKVILISSSQGLEEAGDGIWEQIEIPSCPDLLTPIVYAIPAQLLAYHTAVAKGTDVDQPRNLAKSVTVE